MPTEQCEQSDERSFGELLRWHRIAAGLSQARLSERSGLSVRGISDLERGLRLAPRRETVRLLAQALGLLPSEWTALLLASRQGVQNRGRGSLPESQSRGLSPLPSPVDAFVGRSAEIAALIDLFQSPAIRLVTVTGAGGVGKSRLALEVARHIPERIARSAVFVPLAPVSDTGGVVTAIVQAIGVQRGEEATQRERLIAAMQGRRLLLVLDNFEHVLPAAPLLVDLLEGCADLSILVTSCAPLSISGEHRLPLSPMPVPDLAGRHPKKTASDVMNVDSVRLFVDRANAAGSSFELTECNADAVADICRHLEGLPLALELAAARTSVFDPRSLVKLLNPRLPRLTTGVETSRPVYRPCAVRSSGATTC